MYLCSAWLNQKPLMFCSVLPFNGIVLVAYGYCKNFRLSIDVMLWLSVVGLRCWLHSRTTRQTRSKGEICCRSLHSCRNCYNHVLASCVECFPFHSAVHHPGCRDDGRQFNDGHWSYHETTPGWHQDTNELGKSQRKQYFLLLSQQNSIFIKSSCQQGRALDTY